VSRIIAQHFTWTPANVASNTYMWPSLVFPNLEFLSLLQINANIWSRFLFSVLKENTIQFQLCILSYTIVTILNNNNVVLHCILRICKCAANIVVLEHTVARHLTILFDLSSFLSVWKCIPLKSSPSMDFANIYYQHPITVQ